MPLICSGTVCPGMTPVFSHATRSLARATPLLLPHHPAPLRRGRLRVEEARVRQCAPLVLVEAVVLVADDNLARVKLLLHVVGAAGEVQPARAASIAKTTHRVRSYV